MTLPSTIIFPLHSDKILSGDPKDLDKYMRELNFSLQRMYEELSQGINGDIRTNFSEASSTWTPTLNGSTPGVFTYTGGGHQIGWVLRQGLMVDIFFDVKWTAKDGTVAGDLFLELPYQVALTEQKPFVGVVQSSSVAYTGGTELVINAISDTFTGEFWYTGDAVASANQQVVATGQLAGHIRYIGKQIET